MEIHRKLSYVGAVLLVVTLLVNYYHQEDHPGVGFNYAYIPGIAMIVVFSISFIIFTKDHL